MVAIFPKDPTTYFLHSIISFLVIESVEPNWQSLENLVLNIQGKDHSRTILYLGHGSASEINTNIGDDLIIDSYHGKKIFQGKKIVLVSCYSAQFIERLSNYSVAIGFGNIPTSFNELSQGTKAKYGEYSERGVDLFKQFFVEIIRISIENGKDSNSSFLVLYRLIKLRINKAISDCSFSTDPSYKLAGELLFELKKSMIVKGNVDSTIN